LANSKKNRGYCVAGRDVITNKWVRLVGDSDGAELNLNQIIYNDIIGGKQKTPYEPFNKFLRIDIGTAVPLKYQPENFIVNQNIWQEIQCPNYNISFDDPADLWGAGDRVLTDDIEQNRVIISQSLYIIKVTNLTFYVSEHNTNRACFQYRNNIYDLGVTINPIIFNDIVSKERAHDNILTISLAGPFFNRYTNQLEHYKLVAAVF